MARRIKKARVKFISLVPRGANQMPVIYKAEDNTANFALLTKASDKFDEDGELLSVVYAPEIMDSQGDIASAAVIKEMMHTAMRDGIHIDVRHDMKPLTKEQAFVAESFEVQKGDPRFVGFKDYSGKAVDVTGAWGTVLKIEDPDLRKQYREGKWNGVSLAGSAEVEQINKADDSPLSTFLTKLATKLGLDIQPQTKDIDMTADELKKALEESNKSLVTELAKVIKGEDKTPEQIAKEKEEAKKKAKETVLKFEGEPTPENIRKFAKQQRIQAALSKVDWTKPESIAEMEKTIKEIEADDAENLDDLAKAAGVTAEDTAEVRKLKIDLHKAQKKSKQPEEKGNDDGMNLSKEDRESVESGRAMAKAMNQQRGHKE